MEFVRRVGWEIKSHKAFSKFYSEIRDIQENKKIQLEDLDMNKRLDRRIAVAAALRGRSPDEFYGIVDGLFQAHDNATDKVERDSLHELTGLVMSIGESDYGIDWH